MMRFCPSGSTKIGATPVGTPATIFTSVVSTPKALKLRTVASPNRSFPTFATISTCAPHSRAAIAWFAPLPPKPRSKFCPNSVSPGLGNLSAKVIRSVLALPTTAIRGVFAISISSLSFQAFYRVTFDQRDIKDSGRNGRGLLTRDSFQHQLNSTGTDRPHRLRNGSQTRPDEIGPTDIVESSD